MVGILNVRILLGHFHVISFLSFYSQCLFFSSLYLHLCWCVKEEDDEDFHVYLLMPIEHLK